MNGVFVAEDGSMDGVGARAGGRLGFSRYDVMVVRDGVCVVWWVGKLAADGDDGFLRRGCWRGRWDRGWVYKEDVFGVVGFPFFPYTCSGGLVIF